MKLSTWWTNSWEVYKHVLKPVAEGRRKQSQCLRCYHGWHSCDTWSKTNWYKLIQIEPQLPTEIYRDDFRCWTWTRNIWPLHTERMAVKVGRPHTAILQTSEVQPSHPPEQVWTEDPCEALVNTVREARIPRSCIRYCSDVLSTSHCSDDRQIEPQKHGRFSERATRQSTPSGYGPPQQPAPSLAPEHNVSKTNGCWLRSNHFPQSVQKPPAFKAASRMACAGQSLCKQVMSRRLCNTGHSTCGCQIQNQYTCCVFISLNSSCDSSNKDS